MARKQVALFGGAFDPVTLGHILVAKMMLGVANFDKIWFLPSYHSWNDKNMQDANHRLNMLKLTCNDISDKRINVCSYEIANKLIEPTVVVLDRLASYIDADFFFCIGTDQAAEIETWHEWERLISQYSFVVMERPGSPYVEGSWYTIGKHKFVKCTSGIGNVSSTEVRKEIAREGISYNVTQSVMQYIKDNNLYKGALKINA
ncbi:MAG TPA: nicotinate (nicotinamide) nucleotide adenylyltransferase [Patescibacteria group bacterium]|nr:nicotinate (nicotinamide) nucleotide adenylyltransferase [Patescibacteria group bacterium]